MSAALGVPGELNGFPVIQRHASAKGDSVVVVVDRGDTSPHRYVVARWFPTCGSAWHQGDYLSDLGEVARVVARRVRL